MKIKWKWSVALTLLVLPFAITPPDAEALTTYAINISSTQPTYRLYNIARFNIQIKKNNQPVDAGSFDLKATFPGGLSGMMNLTAPP